ncbi:hypothetical protein Dxin01_02886 [Deinococcus xinjiangensis]|uniref:PatA-like N-terminal domain-containing protein n=1 Tax=Deinococcus xinjiangensis TaxID=457454 RepID=A0ABP9VHF0_9DEIO
MVSGDLQVFSLLPVMQMLLASGRSGQFTVEHPRGGSLWIENGEVIHARCGDLTGDSALQLLCSLDSGTFTFEPDRQPPERSLHLRQDAVMHRMLVDTEAWTPLLRLFPDWSRTLRFTSHWNEAQPVTRQQFRALSLVGQGHTLRSMVNRSELAPRVMLETLKPFLTGGLIEMA